MFESSLFFVSVSSAYSIWIIDRGSQGRDTPRRADFLRKRSAYKNEPSKNGVFPLEFNGEAIIIIDFFYRLTSCVIIGLWIYTACMRWQLQADIVTSESATAVSGPFSGPSPLIIHKAKDEIQRQANTCFLLSGPRMNQHHTLRAYRRVFKNQRIEMFAIWMLPGNWNSRSDDHC